MRNRGVLAGWQQRWNRNLLRFLGSRVRARIDIEDLAQETYLRLLRSPDLSEVRNPEAYLIRVAGHVVAEWRERQLPPAAVISVDINELADECTPDFELDARITQDLLDKALQSLSATIRAVVLLRVRDGRHQKEIARELGITERQVKRYLERGYERLRQALQG